MCLTGPSGQYVYILPSCTNCRSIIYTKISELVKELNEVAPIIIIILLSQMSVGRSTIHVMSTPTVQY